MLQVAQVPWDREANFRLPVAVWKQMMEALSELCVALSSNGMRSSALHAYKMRQGIPTWELAIKRALTMAEIEEVEA